MAETHDTIDGLLAKFRGYSAGMPPSYHVTLSWASFRRMLDRFEAAHRRELSKIASKNRADSGQLGDAAKLREAIVHMIDTADCIAIREPTGVTGRLAFHIKHTGDAALAATEQKGESDGRK